MKLKTALMAVGVGVWVWRRYNKNKARRLVA